MPSPFFRGSGRKITAICAKMWTVVLHNEGTKTLLKVNNTRKMCKKIDEKKKKGNVEVIEERKNSLIRPRVANVDQAVIVFAAASPNINLDLLDRFIVLVEEQELEAVICINKTDLDKDENYKDIAETYRRAG